MAGRLAKAASGGGKRVGYLSWDDYFMALAFLSAKRSKDPSTQVGAVIVSPDRKILGVGYNGMPVGCDDDALPWGRESSTGDMLDTKYMYVCHAELNAVINKNQASLAESRMYTCLFPCNECCKLLIQAGVKEVVFYSDKYHDKPAFIASRRMMDLAGVKYWQHQPAEATLIIDFSSID